MAPVPRGNYHTPGGHHIWCWEQDFLSRGLVKSVAVTHCVKPGLGLSHHRNASLNLGSNIGPCSIGAGGTNHPPNRRNMDHGGASRCTLRLHRGRGIGHVCNMLRHRFTGCCGRTTHGHNTANRGLLTVLRDHLSGIMCHVNFNSAHTRTHRLIDRHAIVMGGTNHSRFIHIGVPSVRLRSNSIVTVRRGSHRRLHVGGTVRLTARHNVPR